MRQLPRRMSASQRQQSRSRWKMHAVEEPEEMPGEETQPQWYVVHCYSGYENKVKKNLEHRIESMGMAN